MQSIISRLLCLIQVLTNGGNYRHAASAMCLAIAMYVATGAVNIIQHLFSRVGVFLLSLLGRAILLVGHTVAGDSSGERQLVTEGREWLTDSEDDRISMSEASLDSKHFSRTTRHTAVQPSTHSSHETSIPIQHASSSCSRLLQFQLIHRIVRRCVHVKSHFIKIYLFLT